MLEQPKTNLEDIKAAALSTIADPQKKTVNESLSNIFSRFAAPLTKTFAKRLNDQDQAEEKFAEFAAYLIEHRKEIFRKFDPQRGRLQNYLYRIAHRFLSRKKEERKLSIDDITEPKADKTAQPDQEYEAECASMLINLAMKELRVKSSEAYKILQYKFLSEEKFTSQQIAVRLGKLAEGASEEEIKKACNAIDQQMAKAKKTLNEIVRKKIQRNIFLYQSEEQIEEEIIQLQKHASWISINKQDS